MQNIKIMLDSKSDYDEELTEEAYYEGLELIAEEIYTDLKRAILSKHPQKLFKETMLNIWKAFIAGDDEVAINTLYMISYYADQRSRIKLCAFACRDEITALLFIECFVEYIEDEYPDETWEAEYGYIKSNCHM